jgi:DNA polymerase-3 subunit gamma/tau
MVDRRLLLDTAEGIVRRDSRMALEAVRRVDDLGHSYRRFSQELVEVFRALTLCRVLADPGEMLDATADELRELQALAGLGTLEDLQRALTVLVRTEIDLASSSFPRLTLEMALVRLAHLPPARDVGTLVRKIEDLERRLAGDADRLPVASPSLRPSAPAQETARDADPPPKKPEAPASPAAGGKGWQGLVEHVRAQRRPGIASILEQASLLTFELPLMKVGLPKGSFALSQLEDSEYLEDLSRLAEEYFQQKIDVRITALDERQANAPPSLAEERQSRETDRKKRLREDALSHPMVKTALEVFSGEVREVKAIDKGFV